MESVIALSAYRYVCAMCMRQFNMEVVFEGKKSFQQHKSERHSY